MFIGVARKRAIYALIKNSTLKRYPSQLIEKFVKKNGRQFFIRLPVIDNEFRHNIAKVVCGSPRGSTAILTML